MTENWRRWARCRNEDPELFFPINETSPSRDQIEEARAVCAPCPVKAQCLAFALEARHEGIWAGTTTEERRPMVTQTRPLRIKDLNECHYPGTKRGIERHHKYGEQPCQGCAARIDRDAANTARDHQIIELADRGISVPVISRRLGCGERCVRRVIAQHREQPTRAAAS